MRERELRSSEFFLCFVEREIENAMRKREKEEAGGGRWWRWREKKRSYIKFKNIEISKNPIPGFRVSLVQDNIFEWQVGIMGPPDTIYQGGYFLATLKFPQDFPFNPPTFTFNSDFFHPNVYTDGKLCISILHAPGDDPMRYIMDVESI